MNFPSNSRFFHGLAASEYLDGKRRAISQEIVVKNSNEILNLSVEQYADYLTSLYSILYPTFDSSQYTVSSHEADIPGSRFPSEFGIFDTTKSIKRDIISFHVPFQGDISYLHYSPSTFYLSVIPPITVANDEFIFEYIKFYDDASLIKGEFLRNLDSFKQSYDSLKVDFDNYNNGLKAFVTREINLRREALLKKNDFLCSFEIPLKAKENVPKTFSIPSPKLKEKIKISRPSASTDVFVPEPTLDYTNYRNILKFIDDVGKNFERMPSIYKNKEEEDLRDFILMVLDPNFEFGSASGETFNKKGKTDILLRYDSSVAFIAECKFWNGTKGLHLAIDQLLSYLTWRDSKTALIWFVRNKEISPVLETVKSETQLHHCFLRTKGDIAGIWSEHVFHLPADKNKEVLLSILIFHLP